MRQTRRQGPAGELPQLRREDRRRQILRELRHEACLGGGCLSLPRSRVVARSADSLQLQGRLQEAISAYEEALALDEYAAEAWYGLGCAHLALRAFGAAAAAFSRATRLAPAGGEAHYNLAAALFELGQVEHAIEHYRRAGDLSPELAHKALGNIACIIPGNQGADHEAVFRARRRWALQESQGLRQWHRAAPARSPPPSIDTTRKLRVGYLSAFFGSRNWMKPVFGLINRHDRTAFDIHLFSDGELPTPAVGYRHGEVDSVHDIRGADNDHVARYIASLQIDVLVDLNGYSHPSRLPLLMRRPAPHVLGWFNLFATSGIDALDWLIGDEAVISAAEESWYCEKIHRLPGTWVAFEVLYPVPEVTPPPCLEPGAALTFGCLGSQYKLTDAVLASWARILAAAPKARLFIKNAALGDASTQALLGDRLAAAGLGPERVSLEGPSEHFDFLAAYRRVDVALDTFPYNGGTTTMEALWQGVPVLSFDGDRWASRTSKTLLLAAGLSDWLMPDLAAYENRASMLANDTATPARLAALRASLRDTLRASPACDTDGLRRAMESFYRRL